MPTVVSHTAADANSRNFCKCDESIGNIDDRFCGFRDLLIGFVDDASRGTLFDCGLDEVVAIVVSILESPKRRPWALVFENRC